MEIFNINLLWIFFILLCAIAYWYSTIPAKLPPGPIGYPIIGSILSIPKKKFLFFDQMAKQYGNIFCLYMGSTLVVILNDYEAIKEALIKQATTFSGRFEDQRIDFYKESSQGIIMADGEYWRQHRRFILHSLRDNGVGKLTLEPLLLNELRFFLAEMKNHTGKPYDIRNLMYYNMINNVILLINGKRLDYEDHLLQEFAQGLLQLSHTTSSVALFTFFPWIKHIPGIGWLTNTKHQLNDLEKHFKVTQDIVGMGLSKNERPTDNSYAQAYHDERQKRLEQNKNEEIFTAMGLFLNSRDLLNAGGETSSTTLTWSLLYMTFYPEIQKKVQREIDEVIGRDREPSYADRLNTPYTEATLLEIQRMVSLVPLSLPHRTTKDTTLNEFKVPKDTMVLPNLYAVHHDPQLWGDPHNFRPERFIGEDGKLNKPNYLFPFSIGKRACAGEPLAKMELYLYFVCLMQHFDVVPTQGVEQSLEAAEGGIVREPICTTVCLNSRY